MGSMDTKRQELTEEDDDSSSIDLGKVPNMSKLNFFFDNIAFCEFLVSLSSQKLIEHKFDY